jgi:uncharacterized membrane protein
MSDLPNHQVSVYTSNDENVYTSSDNTEEDGPLMKMSVNWEVIGTWRIRTSPMAMKINLNMLGALVLNGVGEEVDDADVIAVD